MIIRFFINVDGAPFESSEIKTLRTALDALSDYARLEYRDQNASALAKLAAVRLLIVSGPGTGKSHLFLDRINHWYQQDQSANVAVTSFVRKLVADLQNDIKNDEILTDDQKGNLIVSTLHKFARSIVEKNHGTTEWRFKPHFRIIGQFWKEIVWDDVLDFYPDIDRRAHTWKKFEGQLHDNKFEEIDKWKALKKAYFELCQFYNAAGFADLILRATNALVENPTLNKNKYFIIDEYQDFNRAEDAFIGQLVDNHRGLLIVGDDEQVLYEKLKSGKAVLIRNLYMNADYVKGMLPFCGRSSYHITKTADHFIQQHRKEDCIEKIYLPLITNTDDPKVHVVACATPQTAVDYIGKFIADHKADIAERKNQLETGEPKDAFLLILTPEKEARFYRSKGANDALKKIVAEYQTEMQSFSEDYYRLISYYSLAKHPNNNFAFRKVLYYEGISKDNVHELIAKAIQNAKNLCDLDFQEIKDVLNKCNEIKLVIESDGLTDRKLDQISKLISLANKEKLQNDMDRKAINQDEIARLGHEEEEEAETEEIEVKRMGTVELMTIVGSKGLSADHVIIIGFDDVNMQYLTKNAFYVAMTRARKSLQILTALKAGGARQAHSFLDQLPDAHTEFYSYKKADRSKKQLQGKKEFKNYIDRLNSMSK